MSRSHDLVQRVVAARRDPASAVLEGAHALKHAVRFGADVTDVVVLDTVPDGALPPEAATVAEVSVRVPADVFDRVVPARPPVPVVAVARRPTVTAGEVLAAPGRVVLLERPTHAGNVGAAVRVAAAAGAGGLVTVGGVDPWSAAAIRGGAGLQFALPVARARPPVGVARPLVAFDPGGPDLRDVGLPAHAVLAFGTERHGLSDALRAAADLTVAIPMRPGVSSLNLATAVAVALYTGAPVVGS